jgi:hypothetical protein
LTWNASASQWQPQALALASGTVTNIAAGNGLLGGAITTTGTLAVDTGTTGNQILQLTSDAQIPAVDGFLVTNINAAKIQGQNVASTVPGVGQILAWNATTSEWQAMAPATNGTVTRVATGAGLLGGPILTTGTIAQPVQLRSMWAEAPIRLCR